LNLESRKIIIEGINPADLFGINNINLKHLKTFFPKLSILSRGNMVIIDGGTGVD
jgi:phosphate starvation-inducible protein PhoH and related proteins